MDIKQLIKYANESHYLQQIYEIDKRILQLECAINCAYHTCLRQDKYHVRHDIPFHERLYVQYIATQYINELFYQKIDTNLTFKLKYHAMQAV